jgi:hypothetical protein
MYCTKNEQLGRGRTPLWLTTPFTRLSTGISQQSVDKPGPVYPDHRDLSGINPPTCESHSLIYLPFFFISASWVPSSTIFP